MNAQQQKQFKLDIIKWALVPLLTQLVSILGDEALDWVKDLLDGKKEETKPETLDDANPPTCPPGKEWNPITKQCQDPIGK